MRLFLYLAFLFFTLTASAQTFNGGGGHIPDDGNSVDFTIPVSGLPAVLDTLNFGLESICFNITHAWVADLSIVLVAPDGTTIALLSGVGGDTDGFVNTCLSNNAGTSIFQVWYPFTGTFRPFGEMGKINVKNINPNGNWTLHILDTYAFADEGDLQDWSITFGNQPCKPFPFSSSDLPILKIDTGGKPIVNEPKVDAWMQLIDHGPGVRNNIDDTDYVFDGSIGIELRGVSSQGMPKKSYGIEVRDSLGEDQDVSLLGMPKTSDYALQANFSDKTLMRNALAYEVFRQLGHYATRTRFCELVLDGAYQGIYILTEKIKRGDDRVDVAKLTPQDTAGTDLTGGYMLKIDWNTSPGWNSQFSQPNSPNIYTYFQHVYPKPEELHPAQQEYIRHYVDSFEVALHGPGFQDTVTGWRRFADEPSFIDYLILNEISKNVDGYRLSTYFFKDRDDKNGKLQMGPPWDYDLAWYNADYCDNFLTTGWAYDINYICQDAGMPFWWERLASDTLFAQNLACRWHSLRQNGAMRKVHLFGIIDSMANVLQESSQRNFQYWPILGQYVWPNPGALPTTYNGEVNKLKTWLGQRLQWLDAVINENLPTVQATFQAASVNAYLWQFSAPGGFSYLWHFGDGSTSEEANPQHQFAGTGTYEVSLTVSTPFGCTAESSQIIHIVNSGTHDPAAEPVQVWPNPANDLLHVQIPETFSGEATLRLVNTLGQTMREQIVPAGQGKMEIRTENLPRGVYSLELRGARTSAGVRVVLE